MGALAETTIGGIKGKTFATNECKLRSATTSEKHGPPVSFPRAPFGPSLRKSAMQRLDLVPGLLLKPTRKPHKICRRGNTRCLLECGGGGAMLPIFGPRKHVERTDCRRTWCLLEGIELREVQVKRRRHHCIAWPFSTVSRSASQNGSSLSSEGQSATWVSRNESNSESPQQGRHVRRGAQHAEGRAKMHWQKALAFVLGAVCCSSPCSAQGLPATTSPYVATTTSIAGESRPPLQFVSRAERPSKVTASARAYDPVDTRDRAAAAAFESRASNAVSLLSDARQAAGAGRWSEALQTYSQVCGHTTALTACLNHKTFEFITWSSRHGPQARVYRTPSICYPRKSAC